MRHFMILLMFFTLPTYSQIPDTKSDEQRKATLLEQCKKHPYKIFSYEDELIKHGIYDEAAKLIMVSSAKNFLYLDRSNFENKSVYAEHLRNYLSSDHYKTSKDISSLLHNIGIEEELCRLQLYDSTIEKLMNTTPQNFYLIEKDCLSSPAIFLKHLKSYVESKAFEEVENTDITSLIFDHSVSLAQIEKYDEVVTLACKIDSQNLLHVKIKFLKNKSVFTNLCELYLSRIPKGNLSQMESDEILAASDALLEFDLVIDNIDPLSLQNCDETHTFVSKILKNTLTKRGHVSIGLDLIKPYVKHSYGRSDASHVFNELYNLVEWAEEDLTNTKLYLKWCKDHEGLKKDEIFQLIKFKQAIFYDIRGFLSKKYLFDEAALVFYQKYYSMAWLPRRLFYDKKNYIKILKHHLKSGNVPHPIHLGSIIKAQDAFFEGECRISQIAEAFELQQIPDTAQGRSFSRRLAKEEYLHMRLNPSKALLKLTVDDFMINQRSINCFARLAELDIKALRYLNLAFNKNSKLKTEEVISASLYSYYHFHIYSPMLHQHGVYEKAVRRYYEEFKRMYYIKPKYFSSEEVYLDLLKKHFKSSKDNLWYVQYLTPNIWLKVGDDFLESGGRAVHLTQYNIIPNTDAGLKFAVKLARCEMADRNIIMKDEKLEFIAKEYLLGKYLQFFRRDNALSNQQLTQLIDYRYHQRRYQHLPKIVAIYTGRDWNNAFTGSQLENFMDCGFCVLYYQLKSKKDIAHLIKTLAQSERNNILGLVFFQHGYWKGMDFSVDMLSIDDYTMLASTKSDLASCLTKAYKPFVILESCSTASRPPVGQSQNIAQMMMKLLHSVTEITETPIRFFAASKVTSSSNCKLQFIPYIGFSEDKTPLFGKAANYIPRLKFRLHVSVKFHEFDTGMDCTFNQLVH